MPIPPLTFIIQKQLLLLLIELKKQNQILQEQHSKTTFVTVNHNSVTTFAFT